MLPHIIIEGYDRNWNNTIAGLVQKIEPSYTQLDDMRNYGRVSLRPKGRDEFTIMHDELYYMFNSVTEQFLIFDNYAHSFAASTVALVKTARLTDPKLIHTGLIDTCASIILSRQSAYLRTSPTILCTIGCVSLALNTIRRTLEKEGKSCFVLLSPDAPGEDIRTRLLSQKEELESDGKQLSSADEEYLAHDTRTINEAYSWACQLVETFIPVGVISTSIAEQDTLEKCLRENLNTFIARS